VRSSFLLLLLCGCSQSSDLPEKKDKAVTQTEIDKDALTINQAADKAAAIIEADTKIEANSALGSDVQPVQPSSK
jgi:uncharacterized protein YcfL